MSNVELPLVSSARSTASSSRSSLQSAGSDKSSASMKSRGSQRLQDDSHSDGEHEDEYNPQEEEPQEASGTLWDEVESFLNKPSPSFSALATTSKKPPAAEPKSVLPNLKAEAPRTDNQGSRSTRPSRVVAGGSKAIDPKLLEEAFAYARKVQLLSDDDDDEDHAAANANRRQNSRTDLLKNGEFAPPSQPTNGTKASAAGSRGGNGAVRPSHSGGKSRDGAKPRKKSTSSVYTSGANPSRKKSEKRSKEVGSGASQWDPSSGGDSMGGDDGSKGEGRRAKNTMDPQVMQELVSNFQNGTALEELRKELAASQQSLAFSRQVLNDAAKSFFKPSRS